MLSFFYMKKRMKMISFIAVLMLFFASTTSIFHQQVEVASAETVTFSYYEQLANQSTKDVPKEHFKGILDTYQAILNAYQNQTISKGGKIFFPIGIFSDTTVAQKILFTAVMALKNDYPELSLLNFLPIRTLTQWQIQFEFETSIDSDYKFYTMLRDMRLQKEYIVSLTKGFETLYDKVEFINKWLVHNNDYNDFVEQGQTSSTLSPLCHTAYAALFPSDIYEPVCDGYSYAFKYLLDEINVPSMVVVGIVKQSNGVGLHAWNQVLLYNNWYGVDVTWNDPYDDNDGATQSDITQAMQNHFLKGQNDFYASYHAEGVQYLELGKRTIANCYKSEFSESGYAAMSFKLDVPSVRNQSYIDPIDTIDRVIFQATVFVWNGPVTKTYHYTIRIFDKLPNLTIAIPQRENYQFLGLFSAPTDGIQYYDANLNTTIVWSQRAHLVLYAQWEYQPQPVTPTLPNNPTLPEAEVTPPVNEKIEKIIAIDLPQISPIIIGIGVFVLLIIIIRKKKSYYR